MKWTLIIVFAALALRANTQTATEIIQHTDEKMRGQSIQGEMTIKTIRPNWSREMWVKMWGQGTDYSMILILSPPKEKGIVFLKRKKEVWNWMPVLERTIKLPPSMMSNSWMGTDFTNDDLVKEASIVTDYAHRFLKDTTIDNTVCYQIECIPKPAAAIIWSKLILCIDKKEYLELYTEFFDEEGKKINTMKSFDIKIMDNRLIPTRIEMIPSDKPGQKTVLIYHSILFNRIIPENFFSIEKMKQMNN